MSAVHSWRVWGGGLVLALCNAGVWAHPHTVAVVVRPFANQYRAYAQVQPHLLLPVRAAATGLIASLRVLPGQSVHAGEPLARLSGPDYRAALNSARARARAARTGLRNTQHNYPDFSSAQDVANAKALRDETRATLERLTSAGELRAPVAGTVLALEASPGERVAAGTPVMELLPAHSLWLRATLYGPEASHVHTGLTGKFYPLDGSPALPVRVSAVIPPLTANGGLGIACTTSQPGWRDGETGRLVISVGHSQPLPMVPTAALVLDQGRWWVLVSEAHQLRRQRVEIGPSVGHWTYIRHGLTRGERVVAINAYLLFHADISRHYLPPD